MNTTHEQVKTAALALTCDQVEEFFDMIDQSLWLEYALDLPSITTDRGLALADFAHDLLIEVSQV